MAIVDLETIPQVNLAFMDSDHREEGRLINALGEAVVALREGRGSPGDVQKRFAALDAHTHAHFAREEAAMERAGFPPYPVHKAEHDHVVAEMVYEGRWFAEHRDAERLWAYVSQAVPTWLVGHVESMDLVTARFLAARAARPRPATATRRVRLSRG
jgi:hemerythrin